MSEPLDNIHERCLQGLAKFSGTVSLPGIAGIYVRAQYTEETLSYPCLVWTPEGEMEEDAESQTWETVDVWYPNRCYIADRFDHGNERMRAVLLGWRLRLMDAIRRLASLEGVPEVKDVQIKYGVAIDPRLPQYATVQGAFTARCLSRTIKPAEQNKSVTYIQP